MNRYTLGKIVKFFFHWHYDIRVTGEELLRDKSVHLVLPNHTAYVDPLILFSEMWWLPISPMVDELFMRNKQRRQNNSVASLSTALRQANNSVSIPPDM